MSQIWFFQTEKDTVSLTAKAASGMNIGDAHSVLTKGDQIKWPKGLKFEELSAHPGGRLEVDDAGKYKVVPSKSR